MIYSYLTFDLHHSLMLLCSSSTTKAGTTTGNAMYAPTVHGTHIYHPATAAPSAINDMYDGDDSDHPDC